MTSATEVTAAIILRERSVLIARRRDGDWEFPGGKLEPQETLEQCLTREIHEELDLHIEVVRPFLTVEHEYPAERIRLHSFICRWIRGEPVTRDHSDVSWVAVDRLDRFAFSAADRPIVEELLKGPKGLSFL